MLLDETVDIGNLLAGVSGSGSYLYDLVAVLFCSLFGSLECGVEVPGSRSPLGEMRLYSSSRSRLE